MPASASYRIAGTVVNAVTGAPLQGATVSAMDAEMTRRVAGVETAADGSFALDSLPAAKYALTASKRGYTTGFYMQHGEFSSAIVTGPDQETERLVFPLQPGAVIRGVVTTDGGDAVEGANAMLFRKPKGHEPGARIEQVDAVETDDTGAYEFAHLEAGSYYLAVQARPWYAIHPARAKPDAGAAGEAGSALDVAYPITYYDSTTDEASATPIVLAAGSREEANIDLHAVPALRLEIQAPRKEDGTPAMPELRQSVFGMEAAENESEQPVFHASPGTMEFNGVAPGRYELIQGSPQRVAELDAENNGNVDPSLGTQAATVNGTVATAAGSPPSGDVTIVLTPLVSTAGHSTITSRLNRGSFTFTTVTPGQWLLRVISGNRELPVESIVAGGRRLAGNRISVTGQDLALKAVVEGNPLRMEGFAEKDGKGVAGIMVVLVPKNLALFPGLARRDQSDSDGSFTFRDVAPGAYTVVAIENAWDNLDWSRPEVIGRYLAGGLAVTVAAQPSGRVKLAEPVAIQPR